jgi:hypothetical protein
VFRRSLQVFALAPAPAVGAHAFTAAVAAVAPRTVMLADVGAPAALAPAPERECCLLVLNLVSSTLPCIRRPRPRLRVLDVCGFVYVHRRSQVFNP